MLTKGHADQRAGMLDQVKKIISIKCGYIAYILNIYKYVFCILNGNIKYTICECNLYNRMYAI